MLKPMGRRVSALNPSLWAYPNRLVNVHTVDGVHFTTDFFDLRSDSYTEPDYSELPDWSQQDMSDYSGLATQDFDDSGPMTHNIGDDDSDKSGKDETSEDDTSSGDDAEFDEDLVWAVGGELDEIIDEYVSSCSDSSEHDDSDDSDYEPHDYILMQLDGTMDPRLLHT